MVSSAWRRQVSYRSRKQSFVRDHSRALLSDRSRSIERGSNLLNRHFGSRSCSFFEFRPLAVNIYCPFGLPRWPLFRHRFSYSYSVVNRPAGATARSRLLQQKGRIMNLSPISCRVVFVGMVLLNCSVLAAQPVAGEPSTKEFSSTDEVLPGVTLDGAIIIDEGVWLSLIGEPGRHMTNAYVLYAQGKTAESSEAIGKAASFMHIATSNALEGPSVAVKKAAQALTELSSRVAAKEVESEEELKVVFSRAHLAMAQHHASKAARALAKEDWETSGRYLKSSISYLRRSSYWSGYELQGDVKESLVKADEAALQLREENAVSGAPKLIGRVYVIIDQLRKSLAPYPRK